MIYWKWWTGREGGFVRRRCGTRQAGAPGAHDHRHGRWEGGYCNPTKLPEIDPAQKFTMSSPNNCRNRRDESHFTYKHFPRNKQITKRGLYFEREGGRALPYPSVEKEGCACAVIRADMEDNVVWQTTMPSRKSVAELNTSMLSP